MQDVTIWTRQVSGRKKSPCGWNLNIYAKLRQTQRLHNTAACTIKFPAIDVETYPLPIAHLQLVIPYSNQQIAKNEVATALVPINVDEFF
jgi:hypothetical protein